MLLGPSENYRRVGRCLVYVDGQPYDVVGLPKRTVSLESRSTSEAETRDMLTNDAGGKPLRTEIELAGRRVQFYTGVVGKRTYRVAGVGRSAHALDVLGRLARSGKQACGDTEGIYFDQTSYPDALKTVLNRAGITDAEIDLPLPDPGNGVMAVGAVEPICFTPDDNLDMIFKRLLEMGGCTAFVLPQSGKVRVLPIERVPPETPALAYDNLNPAAYAWSSVDQTFGGVEDIVSRYTCTGGMVEDGVEVSDTWATTEVEGKADGMTNDFWQTMPQVVWAAEFYGRLACREERLFNVEAPMDPGMLPGRSILLHAPHAGVEHTPAYVLSVSTGGDKNTSMTIQCSLGPSQLGGYSETAQPVADFAMIVVAEYTLVGGQPQTLYEVFCDAAGSYSNIGEIVSWSWSVTGATPLAPVLDGPQAVVVLDTLDGVEITLTVGDDQTPQTTASLTQQPGAPHVQEYVRVISTANGDTWSVLSTTTGWQRFTRAGQTCLAVPKYNDAGPLLSLWSDRGIYTTADYLETDATLLATLPGSGALSSACIFVNEADGDDWLVGAGVDLYRTRDGGTTWELINTFSGDVIDCELGFAANTGYLRVLVGPDTWHSYSNGAEWIIASTGAPGAVAQQMASGFGIHLMASTGSGDVAQAALHDLGEAASIDWTPLPVPPTDLAAATPGVYTVMYTVAEPTGELYTLIEQTPEARDFQASATAVATHSGAIAQLVRDGRFGGPGGQGIVYGAANPTLKLLNSEVLREIDDRASQRIGYGSLYVPPEPFYMGRFMAEAEDIRCRTWDEAAQQWSETENYREYAFLASDGSWYDIRHRFTATGNATSNTRWRRLIVSTNMVAIHHGYVLNWIDQDTPGTASVFLQDSDGPDDNYVQQAVLFDNRPGGPGSVYRIVRDNTARKAAILTYPDPLADVTNVSVTDFGRISGSQSFMTACSSPNFQNQIVVFNYENENEWYKGTAATLHGGPTADTGDEGDPDNNGSYYYGRRDHIWVDATWPNGFTGIHQPGSAWGGVYQDRDGSPYSFNEATGWQENILDEAAGETARIVSDGGMSATAIGLSGVDEWIGLSCVHPGQFYIRNGNQLLRSDFSGNTTLVYEATTGTLRTSHVTYNRGRTRDYLTLALQTGNDPHDTGDVLFSKDAGQTWQVAGPWAVYQQRRLGQIVYIPAD